MEDVCLFNRDHHLRIAAVLRALDSPLLKSRQCYFGGGTAIALRFGEYRESVDIDFLVSDADGYRDLRERITGGQLQAITTEAIQQIRDVRTDQYGIRTMIEVAGVPIKFEIIREARIEFSRPKESDRICGVYALTLLDMTTSKLLANSDRWADTSTCSRDIIDLAMMRPSAALLRDAIHKASGAYGSSIERDLKKALVQLQAAPQRLQDHMRAMKMTKVPAAILWRHLKTLVSHLE